MKKRDDHEALILQRRLNVLLNRQPKTIRLSHFINLDDYPDVIDTSSLIAELQKLNTESENEAT